MSLINDALKRAKEAQQNNPPQPPAVPPLRPVESDRRHGPGLGLMLGLILVLLIVATGILLLQWIQMNRKAIGTVNVASEVTAPAIAAVKPESKPEPPPVVAAPAPATMEVVQTNVAAPPPTPPKPEFKLQGISYQPGRSTAVINGRTVHTGDRIGEARVTSITAESVTVVFAGQTNVLTFGEPY